MEGQPISKRVSRWSRWILAVALLLVVGACRPSPSPFATPTDRQALATPTPTATWTVAPTFTALPTLITATFTPTTEVTATPTATPTSVPTATSTWTPAPAEPTVTPTAASTATPTSTSPPIPTVTPTSFPAVTMRWRGEYYANPDLWGNPTLVREDEAIGFDWGEDAPASGLPADAFSVRWSATATFQEGTYNFNATMDDGMRVYVDGELVIDEWRDLPERLVVASRHMSAGSHALRVEYYDRGHKALARLWWEQDRAFAGWKGLYWPNISLLGNPVLIRDDPNVSFDWLLGGPGGGIPVDRFSARWTRTLYLEEGSYRFRIQVDDAARLWIDGQQIIDAWYDHSFHEVTADYVVGGTGPHALVVEYYDNAFDARIHLSWERRGSASYTHWKGEYFANKNLSGEPALMRNDQTLGFDWGIAAPTANLPADGFSARWTREKEFEPGRYRFRIHADDGVRFYVDDTLVVDEWHNARGETYQVDVNLSQKPRLRVEFYEDRGDARIRLDWERIGS